MPCLCLGSVTGSDDVSVFHVRQSFFLLFCLERKYRSNDFSYASQTLHVGGKQPCCTCVHVRSFAFMYEIVQGLTHESFVMHLLHASCSCSSMYEFVFLRSLALNLLVFWKDCYVCVYVFAENLHTFEHFWSASEK